jgi:hypothetical protein
LRTENSFKSKLLLMFMSRNYSHHAQVIEDLKTQLKMWFSYCIAKSCRRSANYAAHELAKLGMSCMPNHVMYWENECPAEIAGFVSGDLAPVVD